AFNLVVIVAALLFVAGPISAIVVAGLKADLVRLAGEQAVQNATLTSLMLAGLSALLCVMLSLALAAGRRALELSRRTDRPGLLEWLTGEGAALVLVVPPIVIGAGWFIALRHWTSVFALAPAMVVMVHAILAMPLAL